MMNDASQWYTLLERNQGTSSWDEFVKLVNRRFGPPLQGNALGELIQLHRDGSVADYQTKFLSLLMRCEDLVEKHQINIFTAGLRNPLKTDIELENPATLEEAITLARTYEQRLSLQDRATPARVASSPKHLLLTVPPPATGAKEASASPNAPHLKRLTVAEMAAKRERGECYNCYKKFSREQLKVCTTKVIYQLQMNNDDTGFEGEADDPRISLHAITSVSPVETMQLQVRIGETLLGTLIDFGSTHSISVSVACRLHL
jgi:hypothetical protein